jgi:hypothetical protein
MRTVRVILALVGGLSVSAAGLAEAKLERAGTIPKDLKRQVRKIEQKLGKGQKLRVLHARTGNSDVISVGTGSSGYRYLADGTLVTPSTSRQATIPVDERGVMRSGDGQSRSTTRGKQFWSKEIDGDTIIERHNYTAGKNNRHAALGFERGDRIEEISFTNTKDGTTRKLIRDAVIRTRDDAGKPLAHAQALSGRRALEIEVK